MNHPYTPLLIACTAFWVLVVAVRVWCIAAAFVHPSIARRRARRMDLAPVSIIIPVKEIEAGLEEAFASAFRQAYSTFEILVSAKTADLPALRVARDAAARFPEIRCRFFIGNDGRAVSPKVNNIERAIAEAQHDLLLVKDSNVRLGQSQLASFVRHLGPGVGLVCAVPTALAPKSFPAEIECSMINGHGAPLLMAASVLGLGFGYGKIMLFDRNDFVRAGGIDAISHSVGEDHALSKALARIGLKTLFADETVDQIAGAKTFRAVWARQSRWMMVRRQEEPLAFILEPFFSGL